MNEEKLSNFFDWVYKIDTFFDKKSNSILLVAIIAFLICLVLKLQAEDHLLNALDSVLNYIRK